MAQILLFTQSRFGGAECERDRVVFRLRVAGLSMQRTAEELNCSIEQVEASLFRMLGGVIPEQGGKESPEPEPKKPEPAA
jgi:hypothetical protein